MFTGLQIKLVLSLLILLGVGGGYLYVKGLQHKVSSLNTQNIQLQTSNDELNATIKDTARTQDIIVKVTAAGDKVREENKKIHDEQLKKIDKDVRDGKDKPIGDLLRNFLNDG